MADTLTEKLVETVFAVHDQPLPPGSLRFTLVRELVVHEPHGEERFRRLLTGEPLLRLEAVIDLSDLYLQSLERLTSPT